VESRAAPGRRERGQDAARLAEQTDALHIHAITEITGDCVEERDDVQGAVLYRLLQESVQAWTGAAIEAGDDLRFGEPVDDVDNPVVLRIAFVPWRRDYVAVARQALQGRGNVLRVAHRRVREAVERAARPGP